MRLGRTLSRHNGRSFASFTRSARIYRTTLSIGNHWASQRSLKCFGGFFLGMGGDVEAAVLFGEAFGIENAALAHPRIILRTVTDDVDRQLRGGGVQPPAELAGGPAAGLLAVGEDNDNPRL